MYYKYNIPSSILDFTEGHVLYFVPERKGLTCRIMCQPCGLAQACDLFMAILQANPLGALYRKWGKGCQLLKRGEVVT